METNIIMHDIAISVKNLSKSFRMYPSPKEKLKELLHPFGKKYHQEFWALQDVSFDIKKGECIGIIGRNGSGKSTLLQVICGVLQPTKGEAKVNGRISALLELGAGFNRDFTGRENVYMNGALMGFSREEMDEKFRAIADFSEIGDFIEQSVKTYSSGMYVRLAFACAVNVDPDILIVDEALSVGDIKFQRKCFAKFDELRRQRKTILFVTHGLDSVNLFCDTAVLIENGKLLEFGEPKLITRIYQRMMLGEDVKTVVSKFNISSNMDDEKKRKDGKEELIRITTLGSKKLKTQKPGKKAEIIDYGILDKDGNKIAILESGERYTFYSRVLVYEPVKEIDFGYPIQTLKGLFIFSINGTFQDIDVGPATRGDILEGLVELTMWLAPGNYFVSFRTGVQEEIYDEVLDMRIVVCGNLNIHPASLVNMEARMTINTMQRMGQ